MVKGALDGSLKTQDPGAGPDLQPVGSSISSDEVSAALSAHAGCGLLGANLPIPQLPEEDPSAAIPQSQCGGEGAGRGPSPAPQRGSISTGESC